MAEAEAKTVGALVSASPAVTLQRRNASPAMAAAIVPPPVTGEDLEQLASLADEALLRLSCGDAAFKRHAVDRRAIVPAPVLPHPPPRHPRSSLLVASADSEACTPRVILLGTQLRRPAAPAPPLPPPPAGLEVAAWQGLVRRVGEIKPVNAWRSDRRLDSIRRLHNGMLIQLHRHRAAAAARLREEAAEKERARVSAAAAAAAADSTLIGRLERLCQQVVQSIDARGSGAGGTGRRRQRSPGRLGLSRVQSELSQSERRRSNASGVSSKSGGGGRSGSGSGSGASTVAASTTPGNSQAGGAVAAAGGEAAPQQVVAGGWPTTAGSVKLQAAAQPPAQSPSRLVKTRLQQRAASKRPSGAGTSSISGKLEEQRQPQEPASSTHRKSVAPLEVRMGPQAYQAHKVVVTEAKAARVRRYTECAHEGRIQLLQESLADHWQGWGGHSPTSSRGSGAKGALAAEDAALMTMQQLVALLVKADVEPTSGADCSGQRPAQTEQQQAQQEEESSPKPREALALKFMAARTISEVVQAAQEHIAEVGHELKQQKQQEQEQERQRRTADAERESRVSTDSQQPQGFATGSAAAAIPVPLDHPQQQQGVEVLAAAATEAPEQQPSEQRQDALSRRPVSPVSPAAEDQQAPGAVYTQQPPNIASAAAALLPAPASSPPLLEPPTADELAAVPLPALPRILDLSHEPARVLQERLERVWGILGVPAAERMGMVPRYSADKRAAFAFESALSAWEACTAAVLQRDGLLQRLAQLRGATLEAQARRRAAEARARRASQRASALAAAAGCRLSDAGSTAAGLPSSSSCIPASRISLMDGGDSPTAAYSCGMGLEAVGHLMWAFQVATHQVEAAAAALLSAMGLRLTVDGAPYPGEGAVGIQQLQVMLRDAWELEQ